MLAIVCALFTHYLFFQNIFLSFGVEHILFNAWTIISFSIVTYVASEIVSSTCTATDIKDVLMLLSIVALSILLTAYIGHVLTEKAAFSAMTTIIWGPELKVRAWLSCNFSTLALWLMHS